MAMAHHEGHPLPFALIVSWGLKLKIASKYAPPPKATPTQPAALVEGVALLIPALELVPAPLSERVPSGLKVRSLAGVGAPPKNWPRYHWNPVFCVLPVSMPPGAIVLENVFTV